MTSPSHDDVPPQTPEEMRWFTEELEPHERLLRAYLQAAAPIAVNVDDRPTRAHR